MTRELDTVNAPTDRPVTGRRRNWVWPGVVVVLVMLLLLPPASSLPRMMTAALGGQNPPLTMSQTSGRWWSGKADTVVVQLPGGSANNQLVLENVSWRLQWSSLLAGRLCTHLVSDSALRPVEGRGCLQSSGVLVVNDLNFALPAADIMLGQMQGSMLLQALRDAIQFQGQIRGQVDSLLWQDGTVQKMQAHGTWSSAALLMAVADPRTGSISRQPMELGELPWQLQTVQPGEFLMDVDMPDSSADLMISAQSRLWLNGQYETSLLLGVRPTTPGFLRDMLRLMAEEVEPGVYRLQVRNL